MSRHDSAPTHGWVIGSHVNRLVVRVSLVFVAVLAVLVFYVMSELNRDCTKPVELPAKVFKYNVKLTVDQDQNECRASESFIPDFSVYPTQ